MFTHKQAWRRQKPRRNSSSNYIRREMMNIESMGGRSSSMPTISSHGSSTLQYSTPRHHTMDNIRHSSLENTSASTNKSKKKCVKFSDKAKVVLVPCREEYKKNDLMTQIWWERNDYDFFKSSARVEVVDLLGKFSGNLQLTLASLYQPEVSSLSSCSESDDLQKAPHFSNQLIVRRQSVDISCAESATSLSTSLSTCTDEKSTIASSTSKSISPSKHLSGELANSSSLNTVSSIQPDDIFFTENYSKQARDSLKSIKIENLHKTLKPVHPLALISS